jgi:hypothetical protein
MRNMNSKSPISLNILSTGKDESGKSVLIASGQKRPRSEGPSTMPASTSAMTRGCPSQRVTNPKTRETTRIEAICSSRSVSALVCMR